MFKRLWAGAACALGLACAGQAGAATIVATESVQLTTGQTFSVDATKLQATTSRFDPLIVHLDPQRGEFTKVTAVFDYTRALPGRMVTIVCVPEDPHRKYCTTDLRGVSDPSVGIVLGDFGPGLKVVVRPAFYLTRLTLEGVMYGGFTSDGGLTITYPGVPEPATWATMIGGFGLAGWAVRRRSRFQRAG